MRKARNTLLVVLTALVILGMLAVAGHAQKVVPLVSKPAPIVSITGAISGYGDPRGIGITFLSSSFRSNAGTFISNPDYPPSLSVYPDFTVRPKTQILSYYYCDSPDHDSGVLLCNVPAHSPEHYKRLRISGGIAQKWSNQVIFPEGSAWAIGFKATGVVEQEGTLGSVVIYNVIK